MVREMVIEPLDYLGQKLVDFEEGDVLADAGAGTAAELVERGRLVCEWFGGEGKGVWGKEGGWGKGRGRGGGRGG